MDGFSDPTRRVSFHFSNPSLDLEQFYHQPAEVDDDIAFYIPSSYPAISRTIRLHNIFYEVGFSVRFLVVGASYHSRYLSGATEKLAEDLDKEL